MRRTLTLLRMNFITSEFNGKICWSNRNDNSLSATHRVYCRRNVQSDMKWNPFSRARKRRRERWDEASNRCRMYVQILYVYMCVWTTNHSLFANVTSFSSAAVTPWVTKKTLVGRASWPESHRESWYWTSGSNALKSNRGPVQWGNDSNRRANSNTVTTI